METSYPHRLGRSQTKVRVYGNVTQLEAFAEWHNDRLPFSKSGIKLSRGDVQHLPSTINEAVLD
jgi:hypothetical protein